MVGSALVSLVLICIFGLVAVIFDLLLLCLLFGQFRSLVVRRQQLQFSQGPYPVQAGLVGALAALGVEGEEEGHVIVEDGGLLGVLMLPIIFSFYIVDQ